MVLIFNSTVSREISGTNFTPTRAITYTYIYIYIYIYVWRYVCHNSSACRAYVMWAELVHCHFLNVPAVLNEVTTGNGTGTKNVLK